MNHEETIKRIQSLVPSVLALEFGCKVLYGSDFGSAEQKVTLGNPYAVKDGKVFNPWNGDDNDDLLEILGKPITLAVIMLAEKKINRDRGHIYIRSDGVFFQWKGFAEGGSGNHKVESTFIEWNLEKDNFNDQSDETKTFIGELLNK